MILQGVIKKIYESEVKTMLTAELKSDMKTNMDRLMKLDFLNQVIITSKIDALYERQMIEEEKRQAKGQPGQRAG